MGGGHMCSLALLWAACPQSLRPHSLCVKGLLPFAFFNSFLPASDFSLPRFTLRVRCSHQRGLKTWVTPMKSLTVLKHLVSPRTLGSGSQPPLMSLLFLYYPPSFPRRLISLAMELIKTDSPSMI